MGETDVDGLLVVRDNKCTDDVFGTSVPIEGVGIYKRNHILGDAFASYACFYVMLIDRRNWSVAAWSDAVKSDANAWIKSRMHHRIKGRAFSGGSDWPETFAGLSESQRESVMRDLEQMIPTGLKNAFGRMGLIEAPERKKVVEEKDDF
jgi:hypothetical protein